MNDNNEPMITVAQNFYTDKFTLLLKNWDNRNEGYTTEQTEELIEQLKRGIYHLNKCREECNHGNLFEQDIEALLHEEETNTR